MSEAFKRIGLGWAEFIIAVAGVAGITSVLLVMMLERPARLPGHGPRRPGAPRDLRQRPSRASRRPGSAPSCIGVFVAVMTGFLPIDALLHLTNIGTLFAFVIVCAAVLIMRRTNPDAERPFRCPLVPLVPILGIGLCLC